MSTKSSSGKMARTEWVLVIGLIVVAILGGTMALYQNEKDVTSSKQPTLEEAR